MTASDDPFRGVFSRGAVASLVDGSAWVQAMLDFEAGLARASATVGLVPADAAQQITDVCRAERFDIATIGADSAGAGNPAVPLIAALKAQLPDSAAGYVHRGATSQDVVDSAMMLLARRALAPILDDALDAARACARLAGDHRDTVMLGRTLLQQAVPITFGLKAAGWLAGIERARRELARAAEEQIALQFGGAAGTLAALGEHAAAVTAALGHELELQVPVLPWHTERTRTAAIGAALALLTGSLGKLSRDVVLLAQNEVGELHIAGGGGSSAMPHKRNPVAAVAVLACATRTPGLAATLQTAVVQEHERAAGAWHAEWEPWSELFRLTGSAAAWSAELLSGVSPDPERMRANLDAAGDLVMTESVVAALGREAGPARARAIVDDAVGRVADEGISLRDALLGVSALPLDEAALERALAPESYLGEAGAFVDAALAAYGERR
jgi:3-carboxy-cis,cis-muconate cycloisomerase